jgi:hypothetical protein
MQERGNKERIDVNNNSFKKGATVAQKKYKIHSNFKFLVLPS